MKLLCPQQTGCRAKRFLQGSPRLCPTRWTNILPKAASRAQRILKGGVPGVRRGTPITPPSDQSSSSVRGRFQREKIPGGGASGKGVRNRIEAGGADCPSVSSGLVVSGDAEIDGFFGGSTTLCGRCSLRADSSCFFDVLLASFFAGFSGGTTGVTSGANTPRSLGSFSDSTHRRKVSLSSSMAAHPARPKHAEMYAEMSAI